MANDYFYSMYKCSNNGKRGDPITRGKIRNFLAILEAEKYIDVLRVRRPNMQVRYIKCKKLDDCGETIYIPGDYMDCSLYANFGIGLFIKSKTRKSTMDFEDFQDYFEEYEWNRIVGDMIDNELLEMKNGQLYPTSMLDDIVEEYFVYWQEHKRTK